ncbi:hypothetical protein [Mycobacterium sp. shizuoka-1]|uniref:hypothetical protein n=1 Tax=Mycobacterium sp. shizuoka-1 TaxID=2039281 RepID=UPI000C0640F4|nr:hypothetical protein [Mycobacterium sp. shizuoka-1]GAY16753.1 hypothetical protein MSZK_34790 [Mycobacterium sp. shizuoka-1]
MSVRAVAAGTTLLVLGIPQWVNSAPAWADDVVTYEVVSDDVAAANIEYQDAGGRQSLPSAPLPWRFDARVRVVRGAPPDGSQVRADWRPVSAPGRWVSVRILYHGTVLCQNTLDVGNAACYGITPRIT